MPSRLNSCDCKADGHCPRYNRYMGGRLREVCAGIDVDLGTAAAFREQWAREAGPTAGRTEPHREPVPILLKADQAAGDAVAMTAAIYSLHRAHPGKYVTAVESKYPEVFENNPDVVPAARGMAELQIHYPAIHRSNERGIHFMQGWCEFLGSALGIDVPLLTDRPHLFFKEAVPPVENYWVICSGGKSDFTAKLWGHSNYQDVVYSLLDDVRFVQVGRTEDAHERLHGADDAVGKTDLRDLFAIVRRARGVLCGVSLLMHVAAALDKPAIVVAGGREPVAWNAYPKQQYVHTVGALPCSDKDGNVGRACWRSRVVPLDDGAHYDRDTCERPVDGLPLCMRMISPAVVVGLVMMYNDQYEQTNRLHSTVP